MHRYRCPICNSKLDLDKINEQRYLAKCTICDFIHIFQENYARKDEAYLKLLQDFDEGNIPKKINFQNTLEQEGVLKSSKKIEVEKTDLDIEVNPEWTPLV